MSNLFQAGFERLMGKSGRVGLGSAARSAERIAGDASRDIRDWAGAIDAYRRHLETFPGDFAIQVQLGHALKETRDFVASMEAYHAAYRIDARDSDLLVNIGHLHKMRGQQAAACFAYVAGYALDANVDAATELGDPQLAADIAVARNAFFADPTRDPVVLAADLPPPAAAASPDPNLVHGDTIGSSPLFDERWYRQRYDVGADMDAAQHYATVGAAEGHEPHRLFDSRFYRSQVTGDLSPGANLLDHFLKVGGPNGLDPHPLFAGAWYREQHPDAARDGIVAVLHYLTTAPDRAVSPTPLFDAACYRGSMSDMDPTDGALIHYLDYGDAAGVTPIAGFQPGRVLETFGGSPIGGESALELYVHFIGREQALAGAKFDELRPSEFGVRPPPLRLEAERSVDERITAATEVVQRLIGNPPGGDAGLFPDRYAMAKLELLRRDPALLDAAVRDLHAATAATATEVVTLFGVLPLHDIAPNGGDADVPPAGVPGRYRASQRDLASRFRLDHDRVGTVTEGVRISILLPIYRSPILYLERAILSVLAQTYANWELCIVDDCSRETALTDIVERFCAGDTRIKFVGSRRNGGIADATNRALDLATSEYVALFDHDDMLTVDALEIVAARIDAVPDTDWLYSDECKIGTDDQPDELLTKPDWSPALLMSVMYTGHLSVYRTSLVRSVGGFRSAYDFSQDYDLALRISEAAPIVHHIREILYGWRMIEGSAASGGKPEARRTNIAAVQAAMDRRGWAGRAIALPSSNRSQADYATFDQHVSIIIPSDDSAHIVRTVMSIVAWTAYSRYEIVIVTNSRTAAQCREWLDGPRIRFAIFDAPYNFSAKCNAGAAIAQGDYLVFHNDDVLVVTHDWIEVLLEQLVRPGVGGVSPKLLYENGRIQYAGMAVGLRRLTGTTFHAFPRNTATHFNLAQSTRDVGLLCGACCAMPASLFRELGGWDANNVGIAHSDVDLSLRMREAGYRLVYTPHAELIHIGHASIGAAIGGDPDLPPGSRWKKSKADIFLLKRFPALIADDPYFPPTMSGISYVDSPEPYRIHPGRTRYAGNGPDILILSHDLTNSGAPRVAVDMAIALKQSGAFVVVTCPTDGPMRTRLAEANIPVIIDALALTGTASFRDFACNFDTVIVNTVIGWRAVQQLDAETELRWYIHEAGLIDEMVRDTEGFHAVLKSARNILAVSTRTAAALRRHGAASRLLETGIADPRGLYPVAARSDVVRIGVFGSFEPRKGQDIAAQAFAMIEPGIRANATLDFFGRDHDPEFQQKVRRTWQRQDGLHFHGEKAHPDYWYCLADMDIVLVPSRDDPLPLVASDALALGKTIVCSDSTGTSEYIEHGVSGFVYPTARAADLAALLTWLIEDRALRESVRGPARAVYEAMFTMTAFTERLADRIAPVAVGAS
ncbi:glycosyltransferase [Sphingomonas sp. LB3N6]|uniref:glycosyltransferase n=1 Tax=Sphingomonas fucosidasi TaxID=3096164 RepID=UPI002FCAFED1